MVTEAPRTFAPEAGAVTEPVGFVESLVKVSVVVAEFPAESAPWTPSVGELEVPSDQVNAFVETKGPPDGAETVCAACVQPVDVPPSAGKVADAGPDPASETASEIWKLPPEPPPVPR